MIVIINFLILCLASISTAKYDELYWSQCNNNLNDMEIISNTINPMVTLL